MTAQSSVFASLLKDNSEIIIEGFDFLTVRYLVDYLYCGEVYCPNPIMLRKLMKMAEEFQVIGLKEKCLRNFHTSVEKERKNSKQFAFEYYKLGKLLKANIFISLALQHYKK